MPSRKLYLFLAVFLVGIVIFVSGPKVIAPAVSRALVNFAARHGVGLVLGGAQLGSVLSADFVKIWTRKVPTIELQNVSLAPEYFELIQGTIRSNLKARYLGGMIDMIITRHNAKDLSFSGSVLGLRLADHQVFSMIPVDGGSLNLKIDSLMLVNNDVSGLGNFDLADLALADGVTLPSLVTGLPIPVEIPGFSLQKLGGSFAIQQNKLSLPDLVVDSDLLTFRGHFSANLPGFVMIEARGCLQLTQRGVEKVGGLLPFIGGVSTTEPQTLIVSATNPRRIKATVRAGCDNGGINTH